MPKTVIRESFELQTRDRYTKVQCDVGMTVDGRELPSAAVLGDALDEAIKLIQNRITESYKVVPARNEFEQQPTSVKPSPVGTVADLTSQPAPAQPVKTVPFGN